MKNFAGTRRATDSPAATPLQCGVAGYLAVSAVHMRAVFAAIVLGRARGDADGSAEIESPVLFLLCPLVGDGPCGGWADSLGELGVLAHLVAVAADVDAVAASPGEPGGHDVVVQDLPLAP